MLFTVKPDVNFSLKLPVLVNAVYNIKVVLSLLKLNLLAKQIPEFSGQYLGTG